MPTDDFSNGMVACVTRVGLITLAAVLVAGAPAAASPRLCASSDLVAHSKPNGVAVGTAYAEAIFVNQSATPCSLRGEVPRVRLLGRHDRELPTHVVAGSDPRKPVTLLPRGGKAKVDLGFSNDMIYEGKDRPRQCEHVRAIGFSLPSHRGTIRMPLTFVSCGPAGRIIVYPFKRLGGF